MAKPVLGSCFRRKKDHGRAEALLLAAWGLGLHLPFNGWLPPSIQPMIAVAEEQRVAKRAERAAAGNGSTHDIIESSSDEEDTDQSAEGIVVNAEASMKPPKVLLSS